MRALRLTQYGTFVALVLTFVPFARAQTQPLTLKRAVELALTHSAAASKSSADEQRAFASYQESRNQYLPQITVGSGLGDTWGYPLSLEGIAPSLFNVNAQSPLFNRALNSYIHAAASENKAMQYSAEDQRNQIIQDTVLAYLELEKWEQITPQLREHEADAQHSQQLIDQRVQAGVENPQLLTQARLAAARATLHVAQAEGATHELQAVLSQLTGISAASIATAPDSVPALPDVPSQPDLGQTAAESNPTVLFAREHAVAEGFRARAEHRALWPTVDFATQYAVLAKFNNWLQFFKTNNFERNNATVGVVIRFPIFNAGQKAHAAAADAEAARARSEVESAKNQVSQEVLKLQDSVRQLSAAKEVSDLEYEIAKNNSDAVDIRLNAGTASVPDAASARAGMFEKYDAAQDADFALTRARVGLLRATGGLQSWAQGKP